MSDDNSIPENHPIREIWDINRKSNIDLAREGDKGAIKAVLKLFRHQVGKSAEEWERGNSLVQEGVHYRFDPKLIGYLVECFSRITVDRMTPNEAFGWVSKKGHPELTAIEKIDRARIGREVSVLMKEHGGDLSERDAAKEVAAKRNNISPAQARACYRKYMRL